MHVTFFNNNKFCEVIPWKDDWQTFMQPTLVDCSPQNGDTACKLPQLARKTQLCFPRASPQRQKNSRVLPALAERYSPDERPQAAVEADRGGQTEGPDDPHGWRGRKQQTWAGHFIVWCDVLSKEKGILYAGNTF